MSFEVGDRVEVLTGPFRQRFGRVTSLVGEDFARVELEEGDVELFEDRANLGEA